MKTSLALIVCLALSGQTAVACSLDMPDPQADAKVADSIELGVVVGERWPDYEKHILSGKPGFFSPDRRIIRVAFTEALKGPLTPPREISVLCGSPAPEVRERVFVLHRTKGYYLVPGRGWPDYEQALRAALLQH